MFRLGLVVLGVALAVANPPVSRTRKEVEDFKSFLDKTQQDDGQTLEERMAQIPLANVWENSGKFQGDIVLDETEMQEMVNDYATGSATGRNAYIWPNTRWPNNEIPYQFAGHHNAHEQQLIHNAMHDIEWNSCVRFRHRYPGEFNYVLITGHNNGCYAHVGYWYNRGEHIFNVGPGCLSHAIIVHEFLHNLGFWHMQSTYNRYDYVNINWHNIQDGAAHNFDRYGSDMVSNLGLEYEYTSTMHYSSHAFSHNGQPTITATRHFDGVMGQQNYITGRDWHRLRRHYNCPGGWDDELNDEESK